MLNPITVQMLAETHQRDQRELWKQAEVRRICRQAAASQPAQPGLAERVAGGVGSLLTRVSHRLAEYRACLEEPAV
jgi:histone H3/H4